jgi:phage host-nuclease inhibitor protein Gam
MDRPRDDIVITREEYEAKEIAIMQDDFTMALINTETGEILGVKDAPETDTDILGLIEWVGMRRMKTKAKLQGVQAEKAEWLARIEKQYDAELKHLDSFVKYLDYAYGGMLRDYARKALAGQTKTKTLKVAFLELSFGTTRARVDVVDNDKALAFCKKNKLMEAIKVAESVLKSAIPDSIKIKLTADKQEETGLFAYPGGEETFQIK